MSRDADFYDQELDNPYRAPVGGAVAAKALSGEYIGYGGFWRRFLAVLIDGIIVFFLQIAISIPFTIVAAVMSGGLDQSLTGAAAGVQILSFCVQVAAAFGYYCGMISSSKQATLGKMALGLKVTSVYGERITFLNALGRELAKILSGIILMIGYIMAAFDERKQALHDKLAGTLVLRTR